MNEIYNKKFFEKTEVNKELILWKKIANIDKPLHQDWKKKDDQFSSQEWNGVSLQTLQTSLQRRQNRINAQKHKLPQDTPYEIDNRNSPINC